MTSPLRGSRRGDLHMRRALTAGTIAIAVTLLGAGGGSVAAGAAVGKTGAAQTGAAQTGAATGAAQTGASNGGRITRFNESATHSPQLEHRLAARSIAPAAAARARPAALTVGGFDRRGHRRGVISAPERGGHQLGPGSGGSVQVRVHQGVRGQLLRQPVLRRRRQRSQERGHVRPRRTRSPSRTTPAARCRRTTRSITRTTPRTGGPCR